MIANKKGVSTTIVDSIKNVIGTGTVSSGSGTSSKADLTIIIGKDYN